MLANAARLPGTSWFGQGTLVANERKAATTQYQSPYAGAHEF
jgi:hypothetical protein